MYFSLYCWRKLQNARLVEASRALWVLWSKSCSNRDIHNQAMFKQLLEISKGETPQSLSSLYQCSITLTVQKCHLVLGESLLFSSLSSHPLMLVLSTTEKRLVLSSLHILSSDNYRHWYGGSLLFSRAEQLQLPVHRRDVPVLSSSPWPFNILSPAH